MPSKPSLIILGSTTLVSEMEGMSLKEATGSDLYVRTSSVSSLVVRLHLGKSMQTHMSPPRSMVGKIMARALTLKTAGFEGRLRRYLTSPSYDSCEAVDLPNPVPRSACRRSRRQKKGLHLPSLTSEACRKAQTNVRCRFGSSGAASACKLTVLGDDDVGVGWEVVLCRVSWSALTERTIKMRH